MGDRRVWSMLAVLIMLGLSALLLGVLAGSNSSKAKVARWKPSIELSELEKLIPAVKAEQGVVYAAGGAIYLALALRSVYWLREFGYQGPITFVSANVEEAPDTLQLEVMEQLRIDFINAEEEIYHRGVKPPNLQGYQLKPFAVLLAGYNQTVLLDADTLPLCNIPQKLFDDNHDVLFWPDVVANKTDAWFNEEIWAFVNLPRLPDAWQQESSCVLMKRDTHHTALLRICQLNYDYEKVYQLVHGDKDTWRIGCGLEQAPYTMIERRPGAISNLGKNFVQYMPDGVPGYLQGEGLRHPVTPQTVKSLRFLSTAHWQHKHGASHLGNPEEEYQPLPDIMRQVLLR